MPVPPEPVLDEDTVHRLVDHPRMYEEVRGLMWPEVFQFANGQPESLVWQKYAAEPNDVHQFGCDREKSKQLTKPEFRYAGFISANAGEIRAIRTPHGHGFEVTHFPTEGLHHIHISYLLAPNTIGLQKPVKADLKLRLRKCFGEMIFHACVR
jgi:hypothetical protein